MVQPVNWIDKYICQSVHWDINSTFIMAIEDQPSRQKFLNYFQEIPMGDRLLFRRPPITLFAWKNMLSCIEKISHIMQYKPSKSSLDQAPGFKFRDPTLEPWCGVMGVKPWPGFQILKYRSLPQTKLLNSKIYRKMYGNLKFRILNAHNFFSKINQTQRHFHSL